MVHRCKRTFLYNAGFYSVIMCTVVTFKTKIYVIYFQNVYLDCKNEGTSSTQRRPLEPGLDVRVEFSGRDDVVERREQDQRHDRQDAGHEVHRATTIPAGQQKRKMLKKGNMYRNLFLFFHVSEFFNNLKSKSNVQHMLKFGKQEKNKKTRAFLIIIQQNSEKK